MWGGKLSNQTVFFEDIVDGIDFADSPASAAVEEAHFEQVVAHEAPGSVKEATDRPAPTASSAERRANLRA